MKNNLTEKIEWNARFIFNLLKLKLSNSKRDWLMCRIACMGQDVLKCLEVDASMINVQKGRVDYLNDISKLPKSKTRINKVIFDIKNKDIKSLVLQQRVLYGNNKKSPVALYMDSFSELTDQRFYHKKEKWSFCSNYGDIDHSPEFEEKFESKGLLSEDKLYEEYRAFFSGFRKKYGSAPILFLHFPVTLDSRSKFKLRYLSIKQAIDKIKEEFQPFYSFEVDENIVDWPAEKVPGLEDFPYHYNKATYDDFVRQINQALVFKGLI